MKEHAQESGLGGKPVAILYWLIAAALLYGAFQFLLRAYYYLSYPFQLEYGEGPVLYYTISLLKHSNYFFDISAPPFAHAAYPPMFMLLAAAAKAFFSNFTALRIVAAAATLSSAIILGVLVWRETRIAALSIIAGLLFLCAWFVEHFGLLGRVDSLACALSLAGILCFHLLHGRLRYAAFVFFVAAFFTKQNALAAPIAVMLFSLSQSEERKKLPFYVAFYLLLGGGMLLLGDVLSGGQMSLHLFRYTAAARFFPERAVVSFLTYLKSAAALILVSLYALIFFLDKIKNRRALLFYFYFIISSASLLSIGKEGANSNFFIEPFAAAILCGMISVQIISLQRTWLNEYWFTHLAVLIAAAADLSFHPPLIPIEVKEPQKASIERTIGDLIASAKGGVLDEYVGRVLNAGKEPLLVEPFQLIQLARRGLWDPLLLEDRCRAGLFELIITEWRIPLIPGMQSCLEKRFILERQLGPFKIHRLRS